MAKSALPHEVFSQDEQTQRDELQQNPLMIKYEKYRETCKNNLVYPKYHFYSPDGKKINDPNGLCFFKGYYHLFYQQYPEQDPRQHWGHAYSTDMVHWKDLPTAIYPETEQACYSGNTLVEEDRVIAMYHGLNVGNMVAVSSDDLLLNWVKLNHGNPVIPHLPNLPQSGLPYRVFDPFLWKEEDGYYALSGSHVNGRMTEHLFFSQNLEKWVYLGSLMDTNPFVECPNDGACPYFLPFGKNRYILLFFSHSSGSRCLVGSYDRVIHKFTPEKAVKISFDSVGASSIIAPSAISDGNGGIDVIYNLGDNLIDGKRSGVMTLTRHMWEDADGNIRIAPAKQTESLRKELLFDGKLSLPKFEKQWLPVSGKCLEIDAEIDLQKARTIEINVLCDKEAKEYTRISIISGINRITPCGYLSVDTSHSSRLPNLIGRIPEIMPFPLDKNGSVKVKIYIDQCMVEVFVNDSAASAQFAYASLPESEKVSIEAIGNNATAEKIQIWNMDTIYTEGENR